MDNNNKYFMSNFIDLINIVLIIVFSIFLVSYMYEGSFVITGYQDWIYHAFRIERIQEYGISSWDHIWSNGINHWRSYQYFPHIISSYVDSAFFNDIPKTMIAVLTIAFALLRALLYIVMRSLASNRTLSLLMVLISFSFPQQWSAASEYGIYIALTIVPIYFYIWHQVFERIKPYWIFLLAALSGISVLFHILLAIVLLPLFLLAFARAKKYLTFFNQFLVILVAGIGYATFFIPFVTKGYSFSRPYYASFRFFNDILANEYLGLSVEYLTAMILGITIIILFSSKVRAWAKLVLLYCSGALLLIWLGTSGQLPQVFAKIQFGRTISYYVFLSLIPLSYIFTTIFKEYTSRLVDGVWAALAGVLIITAISVTSQYSPRVESTYPSIFNNVFKDQVPSGSIYYVNDSEAAFFAENNQRFVGSYNEHLLPSPLSYRFKNLVESYRSLYYLSEKHFNVIADYSTVLGVQYFIFPHKTPIVSGLVDGYPNHFVLEGTITIDKKAYSIIRYKGYLGEAFIYDQTKQEELFRFEELVVNAEELYTITKWDEEIQRLAEVMRNEELFIPASISFEGTDVITVSNLASTDFAKPAIFLNQHFDTNWQANQNISIEPTSLRLMVLSNLPSNLSTISLKNSWPAWHWPLQLTAIFVFVQTLASTLLYEFMMYVSKLFAKARRIRVQRSVEVSTI